MTTSLELLADTLFAASLDNAVTISNEKIPVTIKDEVSAAAELFDAWICIN